MSEWSIVCLGDEPFIVLLPHETRWTCAGYSSKEVAEKDLALVREQCPDREFALWAHVLLKVGS